MPRRMRTAEREQPHKAVHGGGLKQAGLRAGRAELCLPARIYCRQRTVEPSRVATVMDLPAFSTGPLAYSWVVAVAELSMRAIRPTRTSAKALNQRHGDDLEVGVAVGAYERVIHGSGFRSPSARLQMSATIAACYRSEM